MKPFWQRIQEGQTKGYVNRAVRYKEGWIWFDEFGKDYGPWANKNEAAVLGPAHAKLEEKLLRQTVCQSCGR